MPSLFSIHLGLGLISPGVQVAANSGATNTRWAEGPLVVMFLRGVLKIRLPRCCFPKWDLPLILEILTSHPFAPIEQASIWNPTLKMAFLLTITSGRRISELHYLGIGDEHISFFPDRVELRPLQGLTPKVTTPGHLMEPWELPVFTDLEADSCHELDISRILRAYLEATEKFRNSERLFIVPWGRNRGKEAPAEPWHLGWSN